MIIAEQLMNKERIDKAFTYSDYRALMSDLKSNNETTGPNQNADLVYYTMLNHQRMKRLDKTVKVNDTLAKEIKAIGEPQNWVVLTESWCGDAAQVLPVIQKIVELNSKLTLSLFLRDENPDIMDNYLTNCARSIPKLIIYNKDNIELGTWGPRPGELQNIYDGWKNDPNKIPYKEFNVTIQKWYTQDKSKAIQFELGELLKSIGI